MTGDKLTPFLFDGDIIVRVIRINGIPWFVASDVCRALGLTNPAETVKTLDDDEKGISSADTLGGQQGMIIISEIRRLRAHLQKPEAARGSVS